MIFGGTSLYTPNSCSVVLLVMPTCADDALSTYYHAP